MKLCGGNDLAVLNTFVQTPVEAKAKYMEPGALPMGLISECKYKMLHLVLRDCCTALDVHDLRSRRYAALGMDHNLVPFAVILCGAAPKQTKPPTQHNRDALFGPAANKP